MKRLWIAFAAVIVISFSILGWIGTRIYQEKPPIPDRVVSTDGREIIAPGEISRGQNVWQSMGGMQVGSIWGHGSYVAPDWTADWLHREAMFILNEWASKEYGKPHQQLAAEDGARLRVSGAERQGLFHEHMLACTQGQERVFGMELGRGGQNHGIHVLRLEGVAQVLALTSVGREPCSSLTRQLRGVANHGQLRTLGTGKGAYMIEAPGSCSNHGNANHGHSYL